MREITYKTREMLQDKGIDVSLLYTGNGNTILQESVIEYIREQHGYIIDVRFSNKNLMWKPYYSLIFKKNATRFFKRVAYTGDDYYEVAEQAIQTAIPLLPKV